MTPRTKAEDQGGTPPEEGSLRCGCGALLARVVRGGIELKCRRCRRRLLVELVAGGGVRLTGDLLEP
jgi:hypothetical protein